MIRTLLPMILAIFVIAIPAAAQPTPKLPIIEPIKHKGYTEKVGDKLAFDLVPIPGGTYMIGSPESEKGRGDNEGPQRPVTIKPFWMAKLECVG